jgi:hypothetical protein
MNKMAGMLQNAPFKFAPENGLAYFEDLGWLTVEVESVFEAAHRFHRLTMLMRTRSRNAIPLLVGYIGDAVVGDHWSPRVRHAAINVEQGPRALVTWPLGWAFQRWLFELV